MTGARDTTRGGGTLDPATRAQVAAADPARSSWVAANAGSGKTKVLTDRVARLLLQKVRPEHILCLTYTKAAAANMQNALLRRLGSWAMLDDAALTAELTRLGQPAARLTPAALAEARTLFAQALETPGGLKIQTIHAFCAAILRRFPVEAGIPPAFQEMDERSAALLRADILDRLAAEGPAGPFTAMARELAGGDVNALVADIIRYRDAFQGEASDAQLRAALGLPPGIESPEDALLSALDGTESRWLPAAIDCLMGHKAQGAQDLAAALQALDPARPEPARIAALCDLCLYRNGRNEGTPKYPSMPPKKAQAALQAAGLLAPLHGLMERLALARERTRLLAALPRMRALHDFARAFLAEYDRAKLHHGWLDFDDLILKTRDLLLYSPRAQWVLYRLDGGIDHILIDEAQDTSPRQWEVIDALAAEFLAGQGARDIPRTLFVVGDEKQSIYSFQGADPAAFARMRERFADRLQAHDARLAPHRLLHSFRSAQAILSFVDVTLKDVRMFDTRLELTHRAFFEQLPGRVDLWPFIDRPDTPEPGPWDAPMDAPGPGDPAVELAGRVARIVAGLLDGATLPGRDGPRPVRAADIMILVQSRQRVFHPIIRALKEAGLPVAGADRLRIGAELAVRDLLALLRVLVTPADDLSLAALLRSPLFGLDEAALFALAHDRPGDLWSALEAAPAHADAAAMLRELRNLADFLRPYEMLEHVLTACRGRERLLARLGAEAEEGIDALLQEALAYEAAEPPTLTGFLQWMDATEVEIRRQPDTDSDEIRVMTVHGAKGLESPIVILPDTAVTRNRDTGPLVPLETGAIAWPQGADEAPRTIRKARSNRKALQQQERMRLLYVALTRAENWLIVCGAGRRTEGDNAGWYEVISRGLEQLDTTRVTIDGVTVTRYQPLPWPEDRPADDAGPADIAPLPGWIAAPAPAAPRGDDLLTPSGLGGDDPGLPLAADEDDRETTGGEGPEAARLRGRQIHALLEHLPPLPAARREKAARHVLQALGPAPDAPTLRALLDEVNRLLEDPALAALFAPGTLAEVPVAGRLGNRPLHGVIDRLVIEPARILAVDYKTHAAPPAAPEGVPRGILAQMGAYHAVLSALYPGRRIDTVILWTRTGTLMPLPAELVSGALAQAGLLDAPPGGT